MCVDARGDDLCVDLRAVLQANADRAAVVGENMLHGRLAANFDAQSLHAPASAVDSAAHAALHVAPHAACAAGFAHHVMQQHIRAAGRADREERADDRVGRQRGFEHIAFEPAIENRPGGGGEELDGLRQLGAELAQRFVERPQFLAVANSFAEADLAPIFGQRQRIGRSLAEHRLEHGGDAFEKRVVARIGGRILRAELGNLATTKLRVGAHQQAAAIGQRRERRRVARQDREAVLFELQLADDLRQEQADDVRGGGNFVAGPQLFGGCAAAEHVATFEHADFVAGASQIRGTNKAVVAAADDDRIKVGRGLHACDSILAPILMTTVLRYHLLITRGSEIEYCNGRGTRRVWRRRRPTNIFRLPEPDMPR